MKIKDIANFLEDLAPLHYQESYDNCGLLVGNEETSVSKVLVSLDVTETVIDEAIAKGCELIISHHPLIFSGLKKITGKNLVERCVLKAIQNNVALYAIHTNLDNISTGVNDKIGEVLGIENRKILLPKSSQYYKLVTFAPKDEKENLLQALFKAGAGSIGNYNEASFTSEGEGTFKANTDAKPFVGKIGVRHNENEVRIEVLLIKPILRKVIAVLKSTHPYEEVAYDIIALENSNEVVGSGMVGELSQEMKTEDFLNLIKDKMGAVSLRHTDIIKPSVKRIAWCGGSGSFLLKASIAAKADLFISSDFKYHQFFDADNQIVIADIGHYENEQFTIDLIASELKKKFSSFAILLTDTNTNPINYL